MEDGVLPWIGRKSGRAAITDFVNDSRAMIERISVEVRIRGKSAIIKEYGQGMPKPVLTAKDSARSGERSHLSWRGAFNK